MSDISVISPGVMGSALAHTLLQNDYAVTVWNRTPEKAEPLASAGATVVNSAREAAKASPATITCIASHDQTIELTSGFAESLQGKTIIELSTNLMHSYCNSEPVSQYRSCPSIVCHFFSMLVALIVLTWGALANADAGAEDCMTNEDKAGEIANWQEWQRLTSTPIFSVGHSNVWVHVYVDELAAEPYRNIGTSFPVCAKIVKVSYKDEEGESFVDLTAMVKMPRGYDAPNGDWWYALYTDMNEEATNQGKLHTECVSCHQQASETDYLFSTEVMNAIKE